MDLIITKPYARIHQTELEQCDNYVRAYRASPEDIALQIRVKSNKQSRYAHVNLTFAEARELAAFLLAQSEV